MRDDASPARELKALLRETPIRPADVARFLDALDTAGRVEAIRALGRSEQRRLYDAVDGFLPVRLHELVPPGVADFVAVRHYGKNTLPLFSHFEKRFCRPRGADPQQPGELYGFNFQSMSPLTGPGYYVARESPDRPEVWVDYTRVPPEHPEGWPELRVNERGLGRFVYGFMIDTLRRASEHVTIGSAARRGKDLGSWFILCRED
ncbi:MAG: hypothetical protein OEM05_07770 [Myxococcales bacterium]|nr:hypothetical protein [Myxococcales bacterium]